MPPTDPTAGQITAAQREMILREAENLLTRGRQITPAAVRMRLRDEDQIAISAPALSNVLRQRRRLLFTLSTDVQPRFEVTNS